MSDKQARGGNAPWAPGPSPLVKSDSQGGTIPKEGASLVEVASAVEQQYAVVEAKRKAWETANSATQALAMELEKERNTLKALRDRLGHMNIKVV